MSNKQTILLNQYILESSLITVASVKFGRGSETFGGAVHYFNSNEVRCVKRFDLRFSHEYFGKQIKYIAIKDNIKTSRDNNGK